MFRSEQEPPGEFIVASDLSAEWDLEGLALVGRLAAKESC